MNTQKKVDIVMNLMYNVIPAILLSVIAEMINAGGVMWPVIIVDCIISYILEMLIAIFLPFSDWGHSAAIKYAKPGTTKFRLITAIVTATPFATVMSLAMSFISVVIMNHLGLQIWIFAWLKIWGLFIVIAAVCAFLLVVPFVKLAKKLLHIPETYNPFEEKTE